MLPKEVAFYLRAINFALLLVDLLFNFVSSYQTICLSMFTFPLELTALFWMRQGLGLFVCMGFLRRELWKAEFSVLKNTKEL